MSYTVINTVDAVREACMAIEMLVAGESMQALREDILRKHPASRAALNAILMPIETICGAVAKAVDLTDETVRFLFGQEAQERQGLWDVLYAARGETDALLAANLLDHVMDDAAPENAPSREAEVTNLLLAADAPQPVVAKALLLYLRRQAYRDAFERIVAPATAQVEALLPSAMPQIDEEMRILREALSAEPLDAYLAGMGIPLTLGMPETEGLVIQPQLIQANALSVYIRPGKDRTMRLFWGLCIRLIGAKRSGDPVTREQLHDFLKVLADETKLEMLRLLSSDTMYGAQLAKQLGISPATVSYHVGQLGAMKLVNIRRQENRIYYAVDAVRLRVYLDALGDLLL